MRERSRMVEFRRIQMLSFLILALQFSAAVTGKYSSFKVRNGDEVTLHCENVLKDQDECDSDTRHGKTHTNAKTKSDRLSVTANCSVVIKNVTVEGVGHYTCQQYDESKQQQQEGLDTDCDLFAIKMTEHKTNETVMLNCSVWTFRECPHTVKCLVNSKDVDKYINKFKTSQSSCNTTFNCTVKDNDSKKVKLFIFSCRTTVEKTGANTKTTTTHSSTKAATTKTPSAEDTKSPPRGWWLYIIVAVGLTALLLTVVAVVIRQKKTTGNNTQMDGNAADPQDGVSYASVSFTKKTNSKARVRGDDDDDAVTYSTVTASSSSAVASADPSNLYATVNKPNK